jgi:hypothetical protein
MVSTLKLILFVQRNHWVPFLFGLILQFINGKWHEQFSKWMNLKHETLVIVHIWFGRLIVIGIISLILMKVVSILKRMRRPRIPTKWLDISINYHYLIISSMICVSYLTGDYFTQLRSIGISESVLEKTHEINAYFILVIVLYMGFVKLRFDLYKNRRIQKVVHLEEEINDPLTEVSTGDRSS